MNLNEIDEQTFNHAVLTNQPLTTQFKGKLSPNMVSDLKFSVYGNRYIHIFDPTNTDQTVDQYYDMN